jgi:hypothetical protein
MINPKPTPNHKSSPLPNYFISKKKKRSKKKKKKECQL